MREFDLKLQMDVTEKTKKLVPLTINVFFCVKIIFVLSDTYRFYSIYYANPDANPDANVNENQIALGPNGKR